MCVCGDDGVLYRERERRRMGVGEEKEKRDIQLDGLPCVELYGQYQKSLYPLVPRGHIRRGESLDVPCNQSKGRERERGS